LEAFRGDNPTVDRWLRRVPGFEPNFGYLYDFWGWAREQELVDGDPDRPNRFRGLELSEGLRVQRGLRSGELYDLLDLLQAYCIGYYGSAGLKRVIQSTVRSYFKHNRCALPLDSYKLKGDYDTSPMDMRLGDVKAMLREACPLYRSVFLTRIQANMGTSEVVWFSDHAWPQVGEQLRKGSRFLGSRDRIVLDMPGRKGNERPYRTSIESDGREALVFYLEKVRGPVGPGEPIYVNARGNPLTKGNVTSMWTTCLLRAGLIEPKTPMCDECGGSTIKKRRYINKGTSRRTFYACSVCGYERMATKKDLDEGSRNRYGKGSHEGSRDVMLSRIEKAVVETRAPVWIGDFRAGHTIDRNKYRRIMEKDPEWGERQFEKIAPWLNIVSEDPESVSVYEFQRLEEELEETRRVVRESEWLISDPEVSRILKQLVNERRKVR
jgi:hypothetical protein